MGLGRNLKKMWNLVAEGYSEGVSSQSEKPKAKRTVKKRDNSQKKKSSRNPLTIQPPSTKVGTSSQGTSEKITMETTIEPVQQVRDWSIDRIHTLAEGDLQQQFNAIAIAEEFDEWINIPEGEDELTYLVLETDEWTEDQEIDTI